MHTFPQNLQSSLAMNISRSTCLQYALNTIVAQLVNEPIQKKIVLISSRLYPFLERFFFRFLWFSISFLTFSSFKKVSIWLGNSMFPWYPCTEFDLVKFLSKTYFRIWCKSTKPCIFFSNR